MGKIFNLDNPVYQGINKLVDVVFLSVLWLVFSLPLVTMGASTSAAYSTANKVIRHGRSYVFREFWSAFKSSFKQATVIWLIYMLIVGVICVDIRIIGIFMAESKFATIGKAFFIAVMLFMLMVGQYLFPYIARFEASLKVIVRNSALMAMKHLPSTLLMVAVTAASVFIGWLIPIMIFGMPCIWALLTSLIIERIFVKYMSDEDREREEQLNSKEIE